MKRGGGWKSQKKTRPMRPIEPVESKHKVSHVGEKKNFIQMMYPLKI